MSKVQKYAGVMELVDMQDLGSCVLRRGGSSPFARTNASVLIGFEIVRAISNSEHSKINNSSGLGVAYGYSFSRIYGNFRHWKR